MINLALPTTTNLSELYASADQVAIATLLSNKAVERCITHSLENSREAVFSKLVEIFTAYKASMTAAGAGASAQLSVSDNLKMLPVLILGLLKNVSLSWTFLHLVHQPHYTILGWYPPKCPNTSRSQGICTGASDVVALTTSHALHQRLLLLPA